MKKTKYAGTIRGFVLWFTGAMASGLWAADSSNPAPPPALAGDRAMYHRVDWVPPGLPALPTNGPALCPGNFLKPEQGKAVLDYTLAQCTNRDIWQSHAEHLRRCILRGANLDPLPRRTPLQPVTRDRRVEDGYTVENVAFESIPGFFVTGNLYRPLNAKPPYVAVLSPHGHGRSPKKPEDFDLHGRFASDVQIRCAMLARMGAVVFSIDMFGWGESMQQVPEEAHRLPLALTMQTWNNLRAVDFLLSLDGVDSARVAVTGESGGGTQTFLLAALDRRVAVSVPVVMVSSYFFGGCPCESGLPIHRSAEHFACNAEIAALQAPRPMLVVSDGKDWTQQVPAVEYPFLRRIYALYGAETNVVNVHLANEGHDYGPSKRDAMYRFLAQRLGLNLAAVQNAEGKIDESKVNSKHSQELRVFGDAYPLPANALHGASAVETALRDLQKQR
jgi:dienelactone hydrolase